MNIKEALCRSGRNLQQLRKDKGFSIEALAVLSGVEPEAIIAIESGHFDFPMSTILNLAATLNVDFRQILVDPATYRKF
jgi:transcriptional regulator with XRE-family HTH domain